MFVTTVEVYVAMSVPAMRSHCSIGDKYYETHVWGAFSRHLTIFCFCVSFW